MCKSINLMLYILIKKRKKETSRGDDKLGHLTYQNVYTKYVQLFCMSIIVYKYFFFSIELSASV